ncbi:MAG: hypothetical protein K2L22_04025 [Muribaculaceae bacterium]|nr:hypothetical protein [Muribaculaceae bacterium]
MKRVLLLSSVLALSASVALAQDEFGFPEGFNAWTYSEHATVERSMDDETGYPTLNFTGKTSESGTWFYFSVPEGYDGIIGGQVKPTVGTRSDESWIPVEEYITELNAMMVPNVEETPNYNGMIIPTGEPFFGYYCFYKDNMVDIETRFQVVANIEKVLPNVDVNFSELPVSPGYKSAGDVYWDGDVLNIRLTTTRDNAEVTFELPTYYTGFVGNLTPVSTGTRSEEGWEPIWGKWNEEAGEWISGFVDKLYEEGLEGVFTSGWNGFNIPADGQTYEGTIYLAAGDDVNITRSFKVVATAEKKSIEFNGDFSELNAQITWGAEDGTVYWEGDNLIVRAQAWADQIEINFQLPEGFDGLMGNIEATAFGTRSEDDWYPMWGHWEWIGDEEVYVPGAEEELSQEPGYFRNGNWFYIPADGKTYEGRVYLYADDKVYVTRPFNVIATAFPPANAPEFPTSFDVTVNPSDVNHYQTNPSELSGEYYESFVENAGWILNSCENAIVLNGKTAAENVDLSINLPEGWSGIIAYKYDPSKIESNEGMRKVNGFEAGYPEEIWMPSWMVPMEEGTDFTFAVGEPQIYLCYLTTDAVRDYYVEGHLYDSANSFLIYVNVDVDIEAQNQVAYEEVIAKIEVLQKEYEYAIDEARQTYPSYDFAEWEEIIVGALNQAKEGATQALESANEDGVAFQYAFDGEEIIAMIAEMKKAPLVAENQIAYENVIDQLNQLQNEYEAAVEEIKNTKPDFDFTEWEEIGNMIQSYKGWALQALESANEDGASFFFPFDGEEILAYIDMMVKTANAPEFPESFNVTFNGQTSLDLIEATQGEDEGIFTIKVSGITLEDKVTVALEVPAGWDGFVCMNEEDYNSDINPLTRAYASEWVPVEMLYEYGFKEGNKLTFTADGETHFGSFYLVKDGEVDEANQIQVEFNVTNPTTVGVTGVEAIDANARYFDFNGHQIANPAAGMYIKVLNGKASKVIIK